MPLVWFYLLNLFYDDINSLFVLCFYINPLAIFFCSFIEERRDCFLECFTQSLALLYPIIIILLFSTATDYYSCLLMQSSISASLNRTDDFPTFVYFSSPFRMDLSSLDNETLNLSCRFFLVRFGWWYPLFICQVALL